MRPEYFLRTFKSGESDCWTLVRDIFKDEHDIILPEFPFVNDDNQNDIYNQCRSNLKLEAVQTPSKGCIVVFRIGKMKWHVGYALNERDYIHHSHEGVLTTLIPENADIYKVLEVVKD